MRSDHARRWLSRADNLQRCESTSYGFMRSHRRRGRGRAQVGIAPLCGKTRRFTAESVATAPDSGWPWARPSKD